SCQSSRVPPRSPAMAQQASLQQPVSGCAAHRARHHASLGQEIVLTFCRILQDTCAHNAAAMSRGRAYRSNLVPQPVLRAQPDDKIGNWRGLLGPAPSRGSAMSVLATPRKPSALPQTGRDARLAARRGAFKGQTAGVAPGYVQGNLAILPAD